MLSRFIVVLGAAAVVYVAAILFLVHGQNVAASIMAIVIATACVTLVVGLTLRAKSKGRDLLKE